MLDAEAAAGTADPATGVDGVSLTPQADRPGSVRLNGRARCIASIAGNTATSRARSAYLRLKERMGAWGPGRGDRDPGAARRTPDPTLGSSAIPQMEMPDGTWVQTERDHRRVRSGASRVLRHPRRIPAEAASRELPDRALADEWTSSRLSGSAVLQRGLPVVHRAQRAAVGRRRPGTRSSRATLAGAGFFEAAGITRAAIPPACTRASSI